MASQLLARSADALAGQRVLLQGVAWQQYEALITSGLVDKLNIYKGLGVTEVWVWQSGQFLIYHLRSTGYELIAGSELLPALDMRLLASHVKPEDQFDAVMAFREAIR